MPFNLIAFYEGPHALSDAVVGCLKAGGAVLSRRGVTGADLFTPHPGETVLFDDGRSPAAMIQISGPQLAPLREFAADPAFRAAFHDAVTKVSGEIEQSFGLFEAFAWALPGASAPVARTAPFSFVVRYYGPMQDERAFQHAYTATHPPLLAQFPKIRNVLCTLPVDGPLDGLPPTAIKLGNEVVFDNLADLNASMSSPVMTELRADSANFPPYGHSTHHPMDRQPLIGAR
jgi:uncharacterized protein (TIGR02118 family)